MIQLLKRSDLQKKLQVSASTIDRMIKDGRLPPPVELGPRAKRWPSDQIDEWMQKGCQPTPAD